MFWLGKRERRKEKSSARFPPPLRPGVEAAGFLLFPFSFFLDDTVPERHDKRRVADPLFGVQQGVAGTALLALRDILALQGRQVRTLAFINVAEEIAYLRLAVGNNEQNIGDAGFAEFRGDIRQHRLAPNGQQFFGEGARQRAQTRS